MMEIIKDEKGNVTVYYYNGLKDLLSKKELFENLKINLCNSVGENSPIRIHPVEERGEYHILLWNSGNKSRDFNRLKERLNIFKIEFDGEL